MSITKPLGDADVDFLCDLFTRGWENHHVGAVALYRAIADPDSFFDPDAPDNLRMRVEPGTLQRILRTKIVAEYVALLEVLGVLCITIRNRRRRSMRWSYLNTQPRDVTAFYHEIRDRVEKKQEITPATVLELPNLHELERVVTPQPEGIPAKFLEGVTYLYANFENVITTATELYTGNEALSVRAYNKIKHVFPMIYGYGCDGKLWLNDELPPGGAAILIDHEGTVVRLSLTQQEADGELASIQILTDFGSSLINCCIVLHQLGHLF
ncbi:MAG TPA: hypothetical protein VLA19_00530 [Herpetosiphonaceae bacterium]|nr:hypothetical protein [Herpetosiphonaceae bacterium]